MEIFNYQDNLLFEEKTLNGDHEEVLAGLRK
jgi:hypothetical protein